MRQVPRGRGAQARGPRGARRPRRQGLRLAGRGWRLDRDGPAHLLRRLPQHDEPLLGARHRGPPAVEAPPDDIRHAGAARRVHDLRLLRGRPRAPELRAGDPPEPEDAHHAGEAADRTAAAAHARGGPEVHRRAGRPLGAAVHAAVRHARPHQRRGLHRDGQGPGLHRPRQALHDRGAHRHEPLPQRDRRLADGIPRRQPAGAPLRAHGRAHRGPGRRGAAQLPVGYHRDEPRRHGEGAPPALRRGRSGGRVHLRGALRHHEAPGAGGLAAHALLPPDRRARGHSRHQHPPLVRP
mmetsp:Transcript_11982/g.27165  ORF Transcript_11982/g.27165 Transcript_11982/m.27165 type:complete len:295 (+) Transcript_11982:503-1387(+)